MLRLSPLACTMLHDDEEEELALFERWQRNNKANAAETQEKTRVSLASRMVICKIALKERLLLLNSKQTNKEKPAACSLALLSLLPLLSPMRVLLLSVLLPLAGAFSPAPPKVRGAPSSLFFFGGGSGAKDLDEEVRECVFRAQQLARSSPCVQPLQPFWHSTDPVAPFIVDHSILASRGNASRIFSSCDRLRLR